MRGGEGRGHKRRSLRIFFCGDRHLPLRAVGRSRQRKMPFTVVLMSGGGASFSNPATDCLLELYDQFARFVVDVVTFRHPRMRPFS